MFIINIVASKKSSYFLKLQTVAINIFFLLLFSLQHWSLIIVYCGSLDIYSRQLVTFFQVIVSKPMLVAILQFSNSFVFVCRIVVDMIHFFRNIHGFDCQPMMLAGQCVSALRYFNASFAESVSCNNNLRKVGSWVKLICFLQQSFSSHVSYLCVSLSPLFLVQLSIAFDWLDVSAFTQQNLKLSEWLMDWLFLHLRTSFLQFRMACYYAGQCVSALCFLLCIFLPKVFPAILIEGKWAVGLSLYSVFSNNHFPLMCPNLYSLRTNSESFASLAKHCSIYMLFYCYSALHHLLHVILFCQEIFVV